jgi:hypothetical protein
MSEKRRVYTSVATALQCQCIECVSVPVLRSLRSPGKSRIWKTKLRDETVRRIRGSVETILTTIARFRRLSRPALRPGNEIDADDWVVRFRYRPFPTQKLGRCFGQPD